MAQENENKTGYQLEVKKAFERIEIGVKSVFESENYKRYLKTMSKFHKYSINNLILIMMQAPGGSFSHVAGATTWRSMGRSIKKGAKSIKILIPHPYTKEIVVGEDAEGNKKTEMKELCYFTLGNVFTDEQTEGKELPTICNELQEDSEEIKKAIAVVERVAKCPVYYWNLKNTCKGFYSKAENKIVVKKDMSTSATLKTLLHETVHSRLHSSDDCKKSTKEKELEAESICYVVASALFGVDTSSYSFEYIATWSNGKNESELKNLLDSVHKEANKLISDIKAEMEREEETA